MDVLLVDQRDVLGAAIVTLQDLNEVLLHLAGLFHDMLIGIGQTFFEETAPLVLAELDAVEVFQPPAEIGDQLLLAVNGQILVALFRQEADELALQSGLTLIAVRGVLTGSYSVTTVFSLVCATILKKGILSPPAYFGGLTPP